ncbi:MAG: ribonuclease H [Nitrospirae bacterium]|nr:ribonuclease H [Nitrospirota bacterium]
MALFTDASLNPKIKVGVGACLIVSGSFLDTLSSEIKFSEIAGLLKVKRFEETSSAALEIRTALWAVEEYKKEFQLSRTEKLQVYSDSKCVTGLLGRRAGLQAKCFLSDNTNRLLNNAALYRKFYKIHDELAFEIIKVKGHSPSRSRDTIERIFSFVDKETRKELRLWMEELKKPGRFGHYNHHV